MKEKPERAGKKEGTGKKERTARMLTNPWVAGLLAVCCTALWGSAYPCVKSGYELFQIAGEDVSSKILFAGYRFFAAGIMTFIFSWVSSGRVPAVKRGNVPGALGLGLVQTTLQYIFFYIGVANTTGVKGSIIGASSTFFTILLAHFLIKSEKIDMKKGLGCLLRFSGVVLASFTAQGLDASFSIEGEGFLIISALSYAAASIWSKGLAKKEDPIVITAVQLLFGGAVLMILGFSFGGHIDVVVWSGAVLFLYMAFISSAAFSLWTLLLKYNPVGKVAIYGFMTPVFGVFMSALFLGESAWNMRNLAALLMVSAGIIVVNRDGKWNCTKNNDGKCTG